MIKWWSITHFTFSHSKPIQIWQKKKKKKRHILIPALFIYGKNITGWICPCLSAQSTVIIILFNAALTGTNYIYIYIYIHLTCCCSFNPILGLPCATRHPSIAREPFYALRFCANTHKQISIYSFCFCSCENIKLATMYNMYMGGNRALD